MSCLAAFRCLEQQLATQLAVLEAIKRDTAIQAEMAFETKLRSLLTEYGFTPRDVISILDPRALKRKPAPVAAEKASLKAREMKTYKHPQSGEVVQTKGSNHTVLKSWKAAHRTETIES